MTFRSLESLRHPGEFNRAAENAQGFFSTRREPEEKTIEAMPQVATLRQVDNPWERRDSQPSRVLISP